MKREKEWWEGDKRERDGTCMGGKEVGGGGKWRGGRELRGEDGGAVQEGREHAKKGERWEEGKEGRRSDEGETCVGKGRECVEETSRIVAGSEDVRLVRQFFSTVY